MDADVKYLGIDGQFNIQECKDKCHAEEKCDLFVYQHFDQDADKIAKASSTRNPARKAPSR